MKRLAQIIVCVLALVSGTSCTAAPDFIHHPPPSVTPLELQAFSEQGCVAVNSSIDCSNNEDAVRFCDDFFRPDDILGALTPSLPIVGCQFVLYTPSDGEMVERPDDFLFQGGGMRPMAVRYLVLDNDQIRLIATEAEFRDLFAPIETAEEALAYVVATTNLKPRYDITYEPQYEYDVNTIEDTHIEATSDGWHMNLFHFQVFGCGPHYHQGYEVNVTADGEVHREPPINLYRNPEDDQMCVD